MFSKVLISYFLIIVIYIYIVSFFHKLFYKLLLIYFLSIYTYIYIYFFLKPEDLYLVCSKIAQFYSKISGIKLEPEFEAPEKKERD